MNLAHRFAVVLATVVVLFGGLSASTLRAAETKRPNFILIFTDDQRYDAMSVVQAEQGEHGRFPWFKTPNMDRIAREGMRFRNAFVVNSLCAPSRVNFLTGRYSHVNGVFNNHTPMPVDNVTHATVLKDAGYVTGYFGKWHCAQQKERPGFDHVATFIGQGKYIDCPLLIDGKMTPTSGWIDDLTTDHAIQFIRDQKKADKPFDMVLGFKSPHGPRTPPERAKDRFAGESARPAPNSDLLAPYRTAPEGGGDDARTKNAAAKRKNAGKGKRETPGGPAFLTYFRCISAIDDNIGRVLDALDELKLADDTVVVFASDNGYFFGEHGLGDKRAAYEESLRIPLLVRYPGHIKPGSVSDAMVLNIDYAPTILELAGVKVPDSMQGKSWKALFEGKEAGWRDAYFYEYFFENKYKTPTMTALRTKDKKLIEYPGHPDWTEVYDLAADPFEMKNLARDESSAALVKSLKAKHDEERQRVGFTIPTTADVPPADAFKSP
jgi:arylsulfatase A-like enzyme